MLSKKKVIGIAPGEPELRRQSRGSDPRVVLDVHLIFEARRIMNGANVHKVKELIFAYEQAVLLHNIHWPAHDVYHIECEISLRRYLARQRQHLSKTA
jgi:hypothetical protein